MKICMITDLHFGARNSSKNILDSQKRFFYEQLIPYLKENKISRLKILGDFFDNRTAINVMIITEVYELMNSLKFLDKIDILVGNHDIYFKTSVGTNSLKFLKEFPNVNLIEEIETEVLDNHTFISVPWIVDEHEFSNKAISMEADICFGHFEISNFEVYKNQTLEGGLDPVIFDGFKKVFSGHFHTRSFKKVRNCHIEYIGNPYHLTRNDIDDVRGFTVLDSETLETEFFENTKSSRFITLKFGQKISKELIENNFVDIKLEIDEDYNMDKEKQFREFVKEVSELNPIIQPIVKIEHLKINAIIDKDQVDEFENVNIENLIKDCVEVLNVDEKYKKSVFDKIIDYYRKNE